MSARYIIGLGTNIGSTQENILNAVNAISLLPKTKVIKTSSFYETSPVGENSGSVNFLNAVCEVESELNAHEMLGACLGIEAALGRVRTYKNAPRIIDVDLICGEENGDAVKINSKNLSLPHPEMQNRLFVLEPLSELYPSGEAYGVNIKNARSKIEGQKIKKLPHRN